METAKPNIGNQVGGMFLNMIPGLINTGISLIKDKRSPRSVMESTASKIEDSLFVHTSIDKGVSLSGTKIGGYGTTGILMTMAITNITTNGITKENLALAAIGAGIMAVTQIVSFLKEKY